MALRYIFLDFDSFFASVEQQFRPELRGKPVAVVPSLGVDTTCCIAASYEAKAYGVKTGTGVREARSRCPGIELIEASHTRYVKIHKELKALIHQVIYVEEVLSIDEMYGRMPPHWQHPEIAQDKALEIKSLISDKIGGAVTVSIGLAPNRFIAKLASKLEKPNGLVCVDFKDLPLALCSMELSEVTGIGPRILNRLRSARILNMEDLYAAHRRKLHHIWGSVEGDRMWYALRGIELPPVETKKSTIGHSHVLPPRLRTFHGGHATLHRMLQKACRRLRADGYFAGCLIIQVRFGFDLRWAADTHCFPTQDSVVLGQQLDALWADRPGEVPPPDKVSVTLTRLVHHTSHTRSLFPGDNNLRRMQLQQAMDAVNREHGGRTLYYANSMEAQKDSAAAPMRIAFNHIPDLALEDDQKCDAGDPA